MRPTAGSLAPIHAASTRCIFSALSAFSAASIVQAVDLIARSLAVNPSNPPALVNLGNTYQALGEAVKASDCFQKAIALRPEFFEAHYNLGIARLALRKARGRDRIIPRGHSATTAACRRRTISSAISFGDDARLREGLECFEKALELRPDFAEARWSLALARLPAGVRGQRRSSARAAEFTSGLEGLERWFEPARAAAGAVAVGAVQPFSLAYQEVPNRAARTPRQIVRATHGGVVARAGARARSSAQAR